MQAESWQAPPYTHTHPHTHPFIRVVPSSETGRKRAEATKKTNQTEETEVI